MDALFPYLLLLLAAGALAGFLAGLLGIGGGIVMTPVLFLVLERLSVPEAWHMHVTVATSLAVIVPTGLVSARAHWRRGSTDAALLRRWLVWILLGAASGALLARQLASETLADVFGAIAALLGLKMLLPLDDLRLGERIPRGIWTAASPFLIALVSAMMGIGGATFSVPYMTLFGMPIHRAVGTAAAIGAAIASAGVASYVLGGWNVAALADAASYLGFVHWPAAVVMAPAAMLAAPWGARAAHALPHRALSAVFGIFLLLAAARIAFG
ncbi:MAG: sulfite exporter TauE/SafE family protein [Alphaproteobacteria bacterium]|nr:MAG: sulfite exporter TauE/SafE family protein [Alphaproteobacteria bacterium]